MELGSISSVSKSNTNVIGKTGGRVITGQIDGTDATGNAVTTALGNFAITQIPLLHLVQGQGVSLDTPSAIKILVDGLYRITANLRYAGGTSASRVTRIIINGTVAANESALVFAGTGNVPSYRELMLYAGDVITLSSYVETGSVTAAARANQYFDVNLTVSRVQLAPILPLLSGWSGASSAISDNAYNGATRDITNHWLSCNTWADVSGANNLGKGPDFTYYVTNFQNRAATVGCPLIPHRGNAASTWNSLLDEVVAGTRDSTFTSLGTALAQNCPNTVICRPWWEMNAQLNDNAGMIDTTKFVNAWNRAIPLIRTAFNAAARSGQTIKFSYSYLIYLTNGSYNEFTLYPGNTNVDVIAPDLYGQIYGTTNPTTAAVLTASRQRLQEAAVFAAQKGKPLGLDEWGTHIVEPADGIAKVRGIGDAPTFADTVYDWAEQNQIQHMSLYSIPDGAGFVEIFNYPNFLAKFVQRGNAVATFAQSR